MSIKIIADSAADLLSLEKVDFAAVPLKVITEDEEFVDDKNLDVKNMAEKLLAYRGKSSSSCPNADDWLKAFDDADEIYCVTITGTLSGSYNSACMAKQMYLEKNPSAKVFVLNSLSAGPEMTMVVKKIEHFVLQGKSFEEVCAGAEEYSRNTGLLFILESMQNFANNGRVKPSVAKIAGLLGIRVVGKASDKGDLEPLDKCRGEEKALKAIVDQLNKNGLKTGKVHIAHCFNESAAEALADLVKKEFNCSIEISALRGLCSFYAEKGGLLVGYEKF